MSYFIVGKVLDVPSSYFPVFSLIWTFGCFLLPLMMLQLYFYAKENNGLAIKYIANGVLVLLTLLMLIGIIGFTPILHKLTIGAPIVF
ncbi:hypothetical protein MACH26_23840 [Planctobacterium marinum]|uniref:Uncharacterized protein n=2 Tax=Planctobacterium marinum TaxID=1631968 RepID=A0AA48HH79_9ALTE|nr:hypothetical protein MACH26_23840 [Planctobacterium marinum]